VSTSWMGCDDAFESLDSFATWSVMPIVVSGMHSLSSIRELFNGSLLPVASSSLGWTGMLMGLFCFLEVDECCLVELESMSVKCWVNVVRSHVHTYQEHALHSPSNPTITSGDDMRD